MSVQRSLAISAASIEKEWDGDKTAFLNSQSALCSNLTIKPDDSIVGSSDDGKYSSSARRGVCSAPLDAPKSTLAHTLTSFTHHTADRASRSAVVTRYEFPEAGVNQAPGRGLPRE